MTIIDKADETADSESDQSQHGRYCQFYQNGLSGPQTPCPPASGAMTSMSVSWETASSASEVPTCRPTSAGPIPGAAVYSSIHKDQGLDNGDGISSPKLVLYPPEKVVLKWKQVHRVGAGLDNIGNTCFLNAALQCLAYTAPLTNYLLSREHSRTCHESGICMMCRMQKHTVEIFANSGNVVNPQDIVDDLKRITKHFHFGAQEDAHEFLRYIVDAMQKNCLPSIELDRHSETTTIIHQIFGGYLRSRVKCMNCKAVSDTFEPYLDIALELKSAQSIMKAFEEFVYPEQLDGDNAYKCSRCKKMVAASKRLSIHRGANVLTIALKRYGGGAGGKLGKDVRYPELLDIRPYMSQSVGEHLLYDLYAVLVHAGTNCNNGHYLSYVKSCNNQWYCMNDDIVTASDVRTVLNQQAYILFYVRSLDTKKERIIHSTRQPGQAVSCPVVSQRLDRSKQSSTGFIGPQLPPHMAKNSMYLNGSSSLKEVPCGSKASTSSTRINRLTSGLPSSSFQNCQLNKAVSIPTPKKPKLTSHMGQTKPMQPASSHLNFHNSPLDNLYRPGPSSVNQSPFASAKSTSKATCTVTRVRDMSDNNNNLVVNGSRKRKANCLVPYMEDSSDSDEDPSSRMENGTPNGNAGATLPPSNAACPSLNSENACSGIPFCKGQLNGSAMLDGERKAEAASCTVVSASHTQNGIQEANGLGHLDELPPACKGIADSIEDITGSVLNHGCSMEDSKPSLQAPGSSSEAEAANSTVENKMIQNPENYSAESFCKLGVEAAGDKSSVAGEQMGMNGSSNNSCSPGNTLYVNQVENTQAPQRQCEKLPLWQSESPGLASHPEKCHNGDVQLNRNDSVSLVHLQVDPGANGDKVGQHKKLNHVIHSGIDCTGDHLPIGRAAIDASTGSKASFGTEMQSKESMYSVAFSMENKGQSPCNMGRPSCKQMDKCDLSRLQDAHMADRSKVGVMNGKSPCQTPVATLFSKDRFVQERSRRSRDRSRSIGRSRLSERDCYPVWRDRHREGDRDWRWDKYGYRDREAYHWPRGHYHHNSYRDWPPRETYYYKPRWNEEGRRKDNGYNDYVRPGGHHHNTYHHYSRSRQDSCRSPPHTPFNSERFQDRHAYVFGNRSSEHGREWSKHSRERPENSHLGHRRRHDSSDSSSDSSRDNLEGRGERRSGSPEERRLKKHKKSKKKKKSKDKQRSREHR
ncbi:ubiquitin carboxyl-terminal hydrolase 42 [Polypterus senegalus]|uniref:ubiquitin carboxyl-terminal hydrolase 42 n=1 Tax=Polypterus senegalus TaxID=55291 RepID=UPI0019668796|nr:ubiquitin carboxyl-terminal hydrolase 42 [Polypterus senegalus]